MSLATAVVMDSPGMANVMLPTVVMPPPMAASEPVQKSSTQGGSPGYSAASAAATSAHTRCTCASMPPGSTSRPPASISSGAGHGPAELGDPAAGDADVGLLAVAGRHDRAVADNKVIGGCVTLAS